MSSLRKTRGFTLIEIMVGLVIGLIATVIIFQVFAVAERQKRTTTGTSDAQGNGAIAMFMIERHMKMAGAGLNLDNFACTTLHSFDGETGGPIDATGGATLFNVAAIGDGAGPSGSDTVTLLYYDNPSNPEFRYSDSLLSATVNNPSLPLQPLTAHNCSAGGLALMAQGNTCMLMTVTSVTASSGTSNPATVQHDPAPAGRYNPPTAVSATWGTYTKYTARFQCFPELFRVTYGINARQLEVTEPVPGGAAGAVQTTPVVPDILDLQAQYGIDDPTLVPPIQWVDASGPTWGSPSLANVQRIRAVRIAILALNSEYQKPPTDTGVCDATTDAMRAGWSSWATLTPPADLDPDFHCYRFKVFESVIPLRNVLWAH